MWVWCGSREACGRIFWLRYFWCFQDSHAELLFFSNGIIACRTTSWHLLAICQWFFWWEGIRHMDKWRRCSYMNSVVAFEFMKDVERWEVRALHMLYEPKSWRRSRCWCLPTVRMPKPAQSAVNCWRLWHLVGSGKSLEVEFSGWFTQRDSVRWRISIPCESSS